MCLSPTQRNCFLYGTQRRIFPASLFPFSLTFCFLSVLLVKRYEQYQKRICRIYSNSNHRCYEILNFLFRTKEKKIGLNSSNKCVESILYFTTTNVHCALFSLLKMSSSIYLFLVSRDHVSSISVSHVGVRAREFTYFAAVLQQPSYIRQTKRAKNFISLFTLTDGFCNSQRVIE